MTSAAEIQVLIDPGLVEDLARLHDFVKGDASVTVVGDDGEYPSLAKYIADNFGDATLDAIEGASTTAQAAAQAAQEAAAASGAYPNSAASAVPRGVTTLTLGSGGTGYTNGTAFPGTFTGGGGSGARFKFNVAGGVVTSVYDLEPGYGYTGNPTPVFTASAGGTGATASSVAIGYLVLSGQFYWVAQTDGSLRLYQNASTVATAVTPAVYRPSASVVSGTLSASTAILWNFTTTTGFTVNGAVQSFVANAPGVNGAGQLKIAVPGYNGGVATPVVARNGDPVPQGTTKTGYPVQLTPVTIGGTPCLILDDFVPVPGQIRLEWMGALAYTEGSTAILAGQTITGSSGLTAVVIMVPDNLATGVWGSGTRAGTLFVAAPVAPGVPPAFAAGEVLSVGGSPVAKAGGPVSVSAQVVARVAEAGVNYPTGLTNIPLSLQVPTNKLFGSPSLTVYPNNPDPATAAPIFSGSSIYESTNTTLVQDADAWIAWDTISLKRLASGRVNLIKPPEPNLALAFESVSAVDIDLPPKVAPILLHRQTPQRWHVARADGIANDNAADQMNQNIHHALIYNMGAAMSGTAVLQNPRAWALNSEWAEIEGQKFAYGMLASDELSGGIFDQMQPSIGEPVGYYSFFGTPFSETFSGGVHNGRGKWTDIGIGHGNVRMVSATIEGEAMLNGNGAWTTTDVTNLPVGERKRFRTLTFRAVYDMFIRIQTGYLCIGRFTLEHRFSYLWKGVRLYARYDIGRSLPYTNYGSTVIAPGATITGATSGATATVVIIPDTEITSGTVGAGTAVGRMNITGVTGTFVAGENLTVGGVTRAKAGDAQSDPIGVQQNFGFMLLGTTINRAKVIGEVEKVTGLEVEAELSPGVPNPLYAVPHGQGSRLQTRHAKPSIDKIIYEMIQMNSSWVEASLPITGGYPAGQGSLSGFWVQDRKEGLRKGYNSIYTGTGQNQFEGVFEFFAQRQFREGALL